MNTKSIEKELELQQVLWACYQYWQNETSLSPSERVICYSWILRTYEDRFHNKFHQSKLQRLTKDGFLSQEDVSRSTRRRYYKIVAPDQVENLLRKWELY
jgi:hypothetical protein